MKVRTIHAAIAVCVYLMGTTMASATLISSRSALGGNDFIDWGAVSEADRLVPESTEFTTNGGLQGVLNGAGDGLIRPYFSGDFAPGDQVLGTYADCCSSSVTTPRLSITFASAVSAIGTQIQDTGFDYSFFGTISVFNALGGLLESYTLPGFSKSRTDNSALFLGVSRSSADIASVVFGTNSAYRANTPFVINRVDLIRSVSDVPPETEAPPITSVPEPSTLSLFGVALCGIALRSRQKVRQLAGCKSSCLS
jgi:hypothetical protein